MKCFSLVYLSSATQPFDLAALTELLHGARHYNTQHRITGMLVYKDGHFLQALEGDEAQVTQLFARIEADTRHGAVRVLSRSRLDGRRFGSWSMGFKLVAADQRLYTSGSMPHLENSGSLTAFRLMPDKALDWLAAFENELN